jgi:uncharacterized protein
VSRIDSSEAELEALVGVGARLGGFDVRLSAEWIDGALTALMAGPSVPAAPADFVDALFGDSWARTFADPVDVAQALSVLDARWRVLRLQLSPDALWEAPDALRLAPLLLAVPEPASAPDPGESPAVRPHEDDFLAPRLGEDWAAGFRAVVDDPARGWAMARDDEDAAAWLSAIDALLLTDDALAPYVREHYRGDAPPPREQLVDDACYAVQDLRLWWIDHAPRTAPRRVQATPGRNDPCPCGSGRKFKKCHGARC